MKRGARRARESNAMTRPPDVKEIEKEIETIRAEKEGGHQSAGFRGKRPHCGIRKSRPKISWSAF